MRLKDERRVSVSDAGRVVKRCSLRLSRCMMEHGQCDCRMHLIGRQCSEVQPGYFCAPLDYYKYEAEDASGHSPIDPSLPVSPASRHTVNNSRFRSPDISRNGCNLCEIRTFSPATHLWLVTPSRVAFFKEVDHSHHLWL